MSKMPTVHDTYYKFDQHHYPRVTSVISEMILGDDGKKWFTEESRQRGTDVHRICELYDNKKIDLNSIDESYMGYFRAYRAFQNDCTPMWEAVEKRRVSAAMCFGGTIDRVGTMMGNKVILDIKTGQPAKWHGIQLAAYNYLWNGNTSILARYTLILKKHNRGDYKLVRHDDRKDFEIFKAALTVYNYKRRR